VSSEEHRIFEKSWTAVKGRIAGYFYSNDCSSDDIDDLLQETALKACKNYATLKEEDKFVQWVFGIAKHTWFEYMEKRDRKKSRDAKIKYPHMNPGAEDSLVRDILVRQCLEELDPEDRDCLILHDLEGYNSEEIGERLGKSRSNAHYHVKKARKELREKFYGSEKVHGKAMKK